MSDVDVPRLSFGTAAAVFPSVEAAENAAAALVRQGYPRALITVLTGRPWDAATDQTTGITPDPELRFQLLPASPHDQASLKHDTPPPPPLAAFVGLPTAGRRRRNATLVLLLAAVVGLAVVLIALASRDWFALTVVITVALHVFAGVLVWAFARDHVTNFPFRQQIDLVEETLERGGALVTVRCTLPYRSRIESGLAQAGGQVIGYAPEVVYPVPAT